jgi:uncharacterized membrane protein YidH (DUF202 family)
MMHGSPTLSVKQDAGLQAERTVLSWGRTALALCIAALVFVRWLPQHGLWVLVPASLASTIAVSIYATQRSRYSARLRGMAAERFRSDAAAIFWTSGSVLLLGILGLAAVVTA